MTISVRKIDPAHLGSAIFVFLAAFITYLLTVQQTFSFWDCGEFIACSVGLGIPHPPGSPLFILLGRVFAIIPFVDDIAHRINLISVISSSFTALFSYLLTVDLARQILPYGDKFQRHIIHVGGIAGGLMVAFSLTNWANSVEAEVYGLALALMVLIAWLTFRYYQIRHRAESVRLMVIITFLALLGVGLHLSVYLVFPFFAMFFILKPEAGPRDLALISLLIIIELLLVLVFADGRGGIVAYYFVSAILGGALLWKLRHLIRWVVAIAIIAMSSMIIGFGKFFVIAPIALGLIIFLAFLSRGHRWKISWKPALAILVIGLIGFSVHLYLPIRAAQNPRINENNPSRSFQVFLDFLERKQYGQQSMVDRMFKRRGQIEHQFGRHAHMGFWSYFESQYSDAGWSFMPFFVIGMIGLVVAIRKRLELGLPFMTLFLICSVGLILYMNFADGTLYDAARGNAHMEVRERDYFFTPAFVFFGAAIGLGVAVIGNFLAGLMSGRNRAVMAAAFTLAIGLAWPAFSGNYHPNDRSDNQLPLMFAKNMLDNCGENGILFTVGDNETFPLWAAQEVYGYRTDVRVVNTALLQGDWYVEQMKNTFNVPMSFSDEQILTYPTEVRPGVIANRPKVMINDRPRRVQTYLSPYRLGERVVRVPEMVVDDIIIENRWRVPIYFSSSPPGNSPLNLRARLASVGSLNRLMEDAEVRPDIERSWDLYMNKFKYESLNDPKVTRTIGVNRDFMITIGQPTFTLYQNLLRSGDTTRAVQLAKKMIDVHPENWQFILALADIYDQAGDSAKGTELLRTSGHKLAEFAKYNPGNLYYQQDIGLIEVELGTRTGDSSLTENGLAKMHQAFLTKPNDQYLFRKMVLALTSNNRQAELQAVIKKYASYKRNQNDATVRRYLGQ